MQVTSSDCSSAVQHSFVFGRRHRALETLPAALQRGAVAHGGGRGQRQRCSTSPLPATAHPNQPPPLPLSGLHRSAGQEDARVRLGAKVLCRYGRLAGQLPPTFVMSRSRAQHTRCNRRPTRRTTAAPPFLPAATHSSCCTRCTARRVLPCRLYAAAAARCLHVVDACLQSSLRSWTLELEVLAAVLQ